MKDFLQRISTGIIFIALIIGGILWNEFSFVAIFSLVIALGILEFYKLLNTEGVHPPKVLGVISGVSIFLINAAVHYEYVGNEYLYISFLFFFILFTVELYRKKSNPFTNIAFAFFSLIYIAIPIALLVNITSVTTSYDTQAIYYRRELLLGYFFLVWASDSGAYVFGSLFGKHKLFPRVSPKKSWEGSFGGVVFVMIFAWLFYKFIPELGLSPAMSYLNWVIIGVIIVVMGTFGDLLESLLKRSIYIKDSGSILPGHGGILDRFDSVFLSAPFVFVYLELFV